MEEQKEFAIERFKYKNGIKDTDLNSLAKNSISTETNKTLNQNSKNSSVNDDLFKNKGAVFTTTI